MKKIFKVTSMALATLFCAGAVVGCGGGEDNSGKTVIKVNHYSGGVGQAWVPGAVKRFEELNKDTKFEDGKTGVKVEFTHFETAAKIDDIQTAGYDVYITTAQGKLQEFIQSDYLLDISGVVTKTDISHNSIEKKLINKRLLQDEEEKYYALPHYEIYDGVSYDVDLFTANNLFLAAPDEGDAYKGVAFVSDETTKKSCGADGIYGTSDDGLPTTLEELIVLCQKMDEANIVPFYFAGYQKNYPSYLTLGLWTSLAGKDQMSVNFNLNGTIDKVTGVKSTPLFDGYDYIYEPEVEEDFTINDSTVKDVYDTVERYYSTAFTELICKEQWIEHGGENESHTEGIFAFMMNDRDTKYGMFIEGSYWYALAQKEGYDQEYKDYNEGKDRNVAWMPLPTALKKEDAVTEGKGRAAAQLEFGNSYTFINKKVESNVGKMEASKAFVEFLYSDDELSAFTKETGSARGLNYTLRDADYNALSTYQKGIWDVRKQNAIVYQTSENEIFLNNNNVFTINNGHSTMQPLLDGNTVNSYWLAFTTRNTTTKEVFEGSSLTNSTAEFN